MIDLGTVAPNFELKDVVTGQNRSLKQLAKGHGLLVMFICRHCPFVQHVQGELAKLGRDYGEQGISASSPSAATMRIRIRTTRLPA